MPGVMDWLKRHSPSDDGRGWNMSDNVLERPATTARPRKPRRHAVRLAATQLRAAARRRGGRWRASGTPTAGSSSTYGELLSDIESVSTHLAALGLRSGDVLCMLLPNWTEAVIYTYAASRLGAVVCPITTIYRQRELSFILERTECKVIVIPSVYRGFDYAAMVRELADDFPTCGTSSASVTPTSTDFLSSSDAPAATPIARCLGRVRRAADDVAVLAFTSGPRASRKA